MGASMKRVFSSAITDTFYTYSTVKIVQVPHTIIASLYRLLQFAIVVYIACYIVWYKKGYQEFQEPRATSIIKVKGLTKVFGNDTAGYGNSSSQHLWDTAEYQVPPMENNAFFIATRQIITFDQEEGVCPSALDDKLFCNSTQLDACPKDKQTPNTFGYFTGKCVASLENYNITVCEIHAWCPEELSNSTEYIVDRNDLANFTVYLKTAVTFTAFNINLRNVRDSTNFSCRYHSTNDPRCPILRIGDILDSLKTNKTALLREGGLIEIRQDWTCNFDFDRNSCFPKLSFSVLQSGDDKQSPGINYRAAQKYRVGGVDRRTLSKIYGLRFVISITGAGGQFNIVNLFVAIGSGIGFLVIADIVCDAIFMYVHKSRERYRGGKFSVCEVSTTRADQDSDSLNHIIPVQTQKQISIQSDQNIYSETL
ncbi:unnamed protein product [Rotaria magnacalcarata]|uniref:P2X purinoceptor n=5 Tax=Rotaria magnacalcarata TaxID=392030 RepID=A0A816QYR5_9BILA|nr:unnamed protein product [Rotaria magnacalcarata]CAF1685491.1 unnamed protein product [Rotaria magnacalcarata]CAF2066877.1 unnamed protein product [Rotaria magnacalcarata]